jgi:hypothetical protein
MPDLLVALPDLIVDEDGATYRAHVSGAETPLGQWEAWIEFIPIAGGPPLASPRETTQPNRSAAVYWATGLTPVYLEGALARALGQPAAAPGERMPTAARRESAPARSAIPRRPAVLDPFSVYAKGESVLRAELAALAPWHLVNIITGYELSDDSDETLNALPAAALIDIIVAAVRYETTKR